MEDILKSLDPITEEVPETRLLSHQDAQRLFDLLWEADRPSAADRAKVQAMADGEPPYDDEELNRMGQGYRCNLNFGDAAAALESSLAGYLDLINSVDSLFQCHTRFGATVNERLEFSAILSEEITRTIKEWCSFEFNYQSLVRHFVWDGVGSVYWPHYADWRWESVGLGDFLVPRGSPANEENCEIVLYRRRYLVHELYRWIADEEAARKVGYNPEAIKRAIIDQAKAVDPETDDWEAYQVQLKNHDLYEGHARRIEVALVHYFVQEFDGRISHYIGLEKGGEDFLYCKKCKFRTMGEVSIFFTYGIGNGTLHSIRGLGYKLFPQAQVLNRAWSTVIDGMVMSNTLLLQPDSANDIAKMGVIYNGPLTYLPPGAKVVENRFSNPSQNSLPILANMALQMQNNTGTYQQRGVSSDGQERTKFEVQAQLQQNATLSSAAYNLFYIPWAKVGREMIRRMAAKDYPASRPGGKEVVALKERLLRRGCPVEALYEIDRVYPVRAIGNGSQSMRLLVASELMEMLPTLDEVGRRNVIRDRVAARVGYDMADRYAPKPQTGQRRSVDFQLAELQNAAIMGGSAIEVQPGDAHLAHIEAHLPAFFQGMQQGDPASVFGLMSLGIHTMQHMSVAVKDPTLTTRIKEWSKPLQEAMAQLEPVVQKMQEQRMQAAQQQAQGAQQQGPSVEDQVKLQKAQLDMEITKAKSQLDMEIERAEAAQRMALRDAENAIKLKGTNARTEAS